MNDIIDNTIVITCEFSNFHDLCHLLDITNKNVDDVLNAMIKWCYHSRPFWKHLQTI